MTTLREYVVSLPKAELHVHIEGTLEPEMMFSLAQRNGIEIPFANANEVRAAYDFADLQAFLDLYYAGAAVLITEEDFFDLTWAYLERAKADGVVHVEIFFDPQAHTGRGVEFGIVLNGITRALKLGELELGITHRLIMCFLRHLSEDDALTALQEAKPYLQFIDGVGLDSGEQGNPPAKFERAFHAAHELGLRAVAHAGEEGPAGNVTDALELLMVERIDHGVNAIDDDALVERLATHRIPLTMCPLSNQRLQVTPDLREHPLKRLMEAGVLVTVNSDDPAYFGGYVADNYVAIAEALGLNEEEIAQLAENSLLASWR
ncbi:MAG: adenosine deaminase [Actinomycetes bacterium]